MSAETTSIVCGHVFRKERVVKVAIHHSDGIWQLVCGNHDHPEDCSDFAPVGMEHLTERQENLAEVTNMEPGWIAEFDDVGGWQFRPFQDEL